MTNATRRRLLRLAVLLGASLSVTSFFLLMILADLGADVVHVCGVVFATCMLAGLTAFLGAELKSLKG
jgi:hypothetical protein